jgi:hypothetical protein
MFIWRKFYILSSKEGHSELVSSEDGRNIFWSKMGEEIMVETQYTFTIGDIPKAPIYKTVVAPLSENQFWEQNEVLYQKFKNRLMKELYTGGIKNNGKAQALPLREYPKTENETKL